MIKAQQKLHTRAAEELLEFCNEEMRNHMEKIKDNFNINPAFRSQFQF